MEIKDLDLRKLNSQLKINYNGVVELVYKDWTQENKKVILNWLNGNDRFRAKAEDLLCIGIFKNTKHTVDNKYTVYLIINDFIIEYIGTEEHYYIGYYDIGKLYKIGTELKNKLSIMGKNMTHDMIERAIRNNKLEIIYE